MSSVNETACVVAAAGLELAHVEGMAETEVEAEVEAQEVFEKIGLDSLYSES